MMWIYWVIVVVLVFANLFLLLIAASFARDREARILEGEYYDEDGDHIYYDRKLIKQKQLEKIKQQAEQDKLQ